MSAPIRPSVLLVAIFLGAASAASGGQARLVPLEELVGQAGLVAMVEVTKVTKVDVPTGEGRLSSVYVAEARVIRAMKSDLAPDSPGRGIAIVGSTVPRSSAVWQPIRRGRYVAFLNPEQGHYRYGRRDAMRPVAADGMVAWQDRKPDGTHEFLQLDVALALKRIEALLDPSGER